MKAGRIVAALGGLITFVALIPVACLRGEGNPEARCQTLAGWTLPGFEGTSTAWTAYIVPRIGALLVVMVLRGFRHTRRPS